MVGDSKAYKCVRLFTEDEMKTLSRGFYTSLCFPGAEIEKNSTVFVVGSYVDEKKLD